MAIEKALDLAREKELDLAEVSPNGNPPVCKLMDYGKYQYHQRKVDTKHKKMQKKAEIKGLRIGFKTGEHDMMTKATQAKKFLQDGSTVKLTLFFRGREAMYKDLAIAKMMNFFEVVKDIATIESPPKGQGNALIMILTPIKS